MEGPYELVEKRRWFCQRRRENWLVSNGFPDCITWEADATRLKTQLGKIKGER